MGDCRPVMTQSAEEEAAPFFTLMQLLKFIPSRTPSKPFLYCGAMTFLSHGVYVNKQSMTASDVPVLTEVV